MKLERQSLLYAFSGISVLLAGFLIYQIAAPLPDLDPPAVGLKPRAQRISSVLPVSTPSIEAFAEIDARPMFLPGRKLGAAGASGDAALQPPDVKLVGIIVDNQDRLALVKSDGSPLATAYRVGAVISGWQVTEIGPDRIVLGSGPTRAEIKLDANRAPPRSPTPGPANSQ